MPEHTPGPWTVYAPYDIDLEGNRIGEPLEILAGDKVITEGLSKKANACLIAAAPDLLEALDGLLREYTDQGNNEVRSETPEALAAMAAIAKAMGTP